MSRGRAGRIRDVERTAPQTPSRRLRLSRVEIDRMIEEAVVDCHDEEEQHSALLCALQENIQCPTAALIVGEEVTLLGFDWHGSPGEIAARCERGGRVYEISAIALQWPGQPPQGAEWVEAYRAWLRPVR